MWFLVVVANVIQKLFELFDRAQEFLKPYREFMSETQCRELIHATGIPTFLRPKGIPENFRIKLSDKPGGIKYVHPTDEGTYIRIMPGKSVGTSRRSRVR